LFSLAKKNSVFSAFASSNEALAQPAGENLGTALVLLVCSFLFLQPIWGQPAAAKSDFVSTATCQECHQEEVDAWTGSHHDWALKLPTTDTVKGDFSDITFTHFGEVTRFFRDGDAFMVTTTGPKGTPQTFPVKYVVGIEPLQQYVLETAPGRLQTLSIVTQIKSLPQTMDCIGLGSIRTGTADVPTAIQPGLKKTTTQPLTAIKARGQK
jgi:hypothetical protein